LSVSSVGNSVILQHADLTQTAVSFFTIDDPVTGSRADPSIHLHTENCAQREMLEACIATRFARQYGARVDRFLPFLLSMTASRRLGAVVGLRPARQARLFLEQYLDSPVEQAISRVFHTPVDRSQVVEIGNLAAVMPGIAPLLFAVLAIVLRDAGARWVVCTATPRVRTMLAGLRLPSRAICTADPVVLGDDVRDWGSYYSSRPQVIAGDAEIAARRIESHRSLSPFVHALAEPIDRIVSTLRTAG
jgi:Thermostable hemolysin